MEENGALLAGELARWPAKDAMAALLRAAGLTVDVGRYSIRIRACAHFVFQAYGDGPLGPSIEADAASVEALIREAGRVSAALARANVRHRFEVYDARGALRGYLHHGWPPPAHP